MFKTRLAVAACGILGWLAGMARGEDTWSGCRVMPNSEKLVLRAEVDGPAAANVYHVEWPATVERVEGQWLRIVDRGSYSVPPFSGWVSTDDVLRLDAAHDRYVDALATADTPCLHWLAGICLQSKGETRSARQEFLQTLRLPPDAGDAAVRAAVEQDPKLLDPALRLAEMKAAEAKTAGEAMEAAEAIGGLCETARRAGISRPRLLFEHAEALRRAYRLKSSGEDDGAADDPALLRSRRRGLSGLGVVRRRHPHADPSGWRGYMGRAELHLYRAAMLEEKASKLLSTGNGGGAVIAKVNPDAAASAAAVSSDDPNAMPSQINIRALDDFLKTLKPPKADGRAPDWSKVDPKAVAKAKAAIDCLAAAIPAADTAIGCFHEAIRRGPGIIEAYRDRGLAQLLTARSEAVLACPG